MRGDDVRAFALRAPQNSVNTKNDIDDKNRARDELDRRARRELSTHNSINPRLRSRRFRHSCAASATATRSARGGVPAGVDAYRLGKYEQARNHLEKARDLDQKLTGPHRFLTEVAQGLRRRGPHRDRAT